MLELIVLGQIPGTGIQISFAELMGLLMAVSAISTYGFVKLKKIMTEYQEKQKEISENTI